MGCSPIKAVRELGLERRETVRSLSAARAGDLKGAVPYERTGTDEPLVCQLFRQEHGWLATFGRDNR